MRYVNCGTDNIWIDCAQLENGAAMSAYNLVHNGGFEDSSYAVWEMLNCSADDKCYTGGTYGRHFYMKGEGAKNKYISQKIYINRPASEVFLSVSGYAKANSVPLPTSEGRQFSLGVVFHFTDGNYSDCQYISFNPDYSAGWQYASGTVGVKDPGSKTVDYVYLRCCYYQNANGANFDRIKMNIDECGTSYTYDDDGNLISAKDNAGRHESYNYNNASDMTKLTTADNKAYKFTYSDTYKHRMLSATSESSGVKNSFTYDGSGNLTSTKVEKSGYAKFIKQDSTYTSGGNYLSKSYTDRGHATTYTYDTYKGTLTSVKDANSKETKYTYDANTDRMKKVTSGGSTVEYTYAKNGQLTSIKSPGSSPTYNFVYDKWGNNTEVKVGSQTLVTNTYKSNNGLLTQQEYGNGFKVGHNYDSLDRETSRSYNGTTKFWWTYNADGNLARYTESSGRVLEYLYDDIGRLLQVSGADGSYVKTSYDKLDKSTELHYKTGSQPRDVYFNYSDKDNLPLNVKFGPSSKYIVENTYDDLTRLKTRTYAIPGVDNKVSASYGYVDWTSTEKRTTGTVRGIDYTYVSGGLTTYDRWYEYDGVGNITSENVWTSDTTKPLREKYTYDAKNQLARHDSVTQNCTITYSYDAGGNITEKKTYAYTTGDLTGKTATKTVNYTYGNSAWKDELTAYNGERIEYDEIGNPTLYRGWGMTWQGRQLQTAEKGGTALNYTYDSEGIRTSKTVGSTTTKYLLNGTQILAQTTNGITTSFFYDQQGNRVAMADSGNHFYYYIYNLQGDVIALADASTGKLVATYTYDAWGKCTVTNASGHTIGTDNPFRYRGYYYDTESELYYLNSRYYDAETGRFINADGQLNDGVLGCNLFAYCENNPVNMIDSAGNMATAILVSKSTLSYFVAWLYSANFWNPVGWIIAGVLAAGAITWAAVTLYRIYQREHTKTVAKADERIKTTVKKNSRTRYWTATVRNGYVDIGRPLTYSQAVREVSAGRSVFAVTKYEAKAVALAAGGSSGKNNKKLVPEIDAGKKNTPGYYYHYHTYNRKGGHVYYMF